MKTIAVFGGTFNPFHIGHEEMLSAVCRLDFVDKVLIMPSKIPPHKSIDFLADDSDRINMCKAVADNYSKASVCDIEIKREGKSYTIDTLNELSTLYPDVKFYLCIGGDMVTSFIEWREYKKILEKAGLIVFSRVGTSDSSFTESIESLKNIGAEIKLIDEEITAISSTEIRNNKCNNTFLEKYLPKKVFDYITDNKVYGE